MIILIDLIFEWLLYTRVYTHDLQLAHLTYPTMNSKKDTAYPKFERRCSSNGCRSNPANWTISKPFTMRSLKYVVFGGEVTVWSIYLPLVL